MIPASWRLRAYQTLDAAAEWVDGLIERGRRHPSNYRDSLDDHWSDVVDLFDDGKALVREVEEWRRGL